MGIRELPPLRLQVDGATPSGRRYRWGNEERRAENVPADLRFSDTIPGGFESMDVTLARKAGVAYTDLERLSTLRVLGAGGDVAWEGRLERAPRVSGDRMAISPSAVGWQAHLDDDKSAAMIYIGRDLGHWQGPGAPRRLAMAAATQSIGEFATDGGMTLIARGPWTGTAGGVRAEAYYQAPAGATVARIGGDWATNANVGTDATFSLQAFSTTDQVTFPENSADVLTGATSGTLNFVASTPRRQMLIQLAYPSAAGADGAEFAVTLSDMYVVGDHGLTIHGAVAADGGVLASDVVAHAVGRWAPRLLISDESIQPSGFVIPHLALLDATTTAEIVRQATRFGLQDWAVWEDNTFYWHERGARGRRWRARIGPSQLEETGPQVDRLWESIIVQYQDVDGSTRTVGPPGSGADTESTDLKDDDPENPANQLGIFRRDLLAMGTGTAAGATEIGARFLEQTKLLDSSGRARIVGHVQDDRGVLHPYWRVRAGDYISFVDAADTSYRRIVKSEKAVADRSCTVDLDAPPDALAALLERLGVVLVPLGL